jgi:hypothetical protein
MNGIEATELALREHGCKAKLAAPSGRILKFDHSNNPVFEDNDGTPYVSVVAQDGWTIIPPEPPKVKPYTLPFSFDPDVQGDALVDANRECICIIPDEKVVHRLNATSVAEYQRGLAVGKAEATTPEVRNLLKAAWAVRHNLADYLSDLTA